jgi:N-acetylglucosamine-6-phosphate deacetylase
MSLALINGRVLTDTGFEAGRVVVIAGGRIEAVVGHDQWQAQSARRGAGERQPTIYDLEGQRLVPGFVDTQVNGGGGVLFNDDPSVDSIVEIGRAHRRYGTTGFLPTLISDDLDVVVQAVRAVQTAIEIGVPGVLGIHIEGPFLNEERKGIHDVTKLRWLDEDALGLLTSLNGGRTLVTLAPERTSPQIIRKLADAGVIIAAGHTNGTYQEIKDALSQGMTGFTHLFNAMSQLTGREPGAVGAALDDPDSWCGIIVDGHHVDPVVLRIALRSKRHDRFMLVTDAMPSVGAPHKSFTLQGRPISVADNKAVDEHGRLAGSDIDMATAVRNAVTMLGVELEQSLRMASRYPAEFLRLDHELGRIAPGQRANLALLDDELDVVETWIDGRRGPSD